MIAVNLESSAGDICSDASKALVQLYDLLASCSFLSFGLKTFVGRSSSGVKDLRLYFFKVKQTEETQNVLKRILVFYLPYNIVSHMKRSFPLLDDH